MAWWHAGMVAWLLHGGLVAWWHAGMVAWLLQGGLVAWWHALSSDLGVARRVVVEALKPHLAAVRRERPLSHEDRQSGALDGGEAIAPRARVVFERGLRADVEPRLRDVRVQRDGGASLHKARPLLKPKRVLYHKEPLRRGGADRPIRVPIERLQHVHRRELPRLIQGFHPEHGGVAF